MLKYVIKISFGGMAVGSFLTDAAAKRYKSGTKFAPYAPDTYCNLH